MGWTSEWKQKTDYGELSCSHNQSNFTSIFGTPNNNTLGSAGTYTNLTGATTPSYGVNIPQTDGSRTWNLPAPESGVWKDVFSITLVDKNTFLPATGNYCKLKVQVNVINKTDLYHNYQMRSVIVNSVGGITVTGDSISVNNQYTGVLYDKGIYINNGYVVLGNRRLLFVGTEEFITTVYREQYYYGAYVRRCLTVDLTGLENLYGVTYPITNFVFSKSSPEFGPAGDKDGGYNEDSSHKGSFDNTSDKIVVSSKPYDSPFRTGFINGYYMNPTNLAKLSDALFPEPGIFTNDIPQMIFNLYTSLWNSKRIDYILDLLIVPVLPSYLTERHVNCGGRPLARFSSEDPTIVDFIDGNPIEDAFVDKDCGTLAIPEYWANFLDFSGTRVKLFLPYVGYVDIEPEFIISGELHVWYRFNVFDGSFMCFVESTSGHSELEESLIGQYAGVAAIHIPLQSQDYSNKISGLISAIGTVGVGLAGGGMSASAGLGATASLVNTVTQKPSGTHANGYNASSSYMSHRKPYLIIERQSSQFSEKYPEEVGLPLYVKAIIDDCHGLTVCENPHLDTIPATMEEKERIYKYLTEGIIV